MFSPHPELTGADGAMWCGPMLASAVAAVEPPWRQSKAGRPILPSVQDINEQLAADLVAVKLATAEAEKEKKKDERKQPQKPVRVRVCHVNLIA